ncbi:MAG TPA: DUF420 domain-containing protein [Myxococcota bacterium]|nr:DUF420 domain-containing protein [Myxococcota bacterium]HND32051.1 DUF420 domain-containing protein [Myxococcota bacterium]
MYPPSPFGTRSDLLIDLVVLSLVVVVPLLGLSWWKVRQKAWLFHRNLMLGLSGVLAVAVTLFELDLKAHGGIFELTRESRFAGTDFLYASIYIHTFFSISTAMLWLSLIVVSLRRFASPPAPNTFSRMHRIWGRIAMIDMLLTGITGVELYVVGLVL